MRKSVFVLAVIAAACSSVAFAGEVNKDKAQVPAVKATTMSDAQMDKVTAGDPGNGNGWAWGREPGKGWEANTNFHGPGPQQISRQLVEPKSIRDPYLASGVSDFGTFSTWEARSCGLPSLGAPQTLGQKHRGSTSGTCPFCPRS